MNRQEKGNTVNQINAILSESQATIVTDFKGLTVDEIRNLRLKVREAGGRYQVAKNTLIKLAAKDTPAESINDLLAGNNALGTTVNDPVALAKTLVDFAKEQQKLVIKGGALAGKALDFEQIKTMASLPGREILLAQLLGTMNSIPTGFVRVLAALPQNLVYALAAVRDQKESRTEE